MRCSWRGIRWGRSRWVVEGGDGLGGGEDEGGGDDEGDGGDAVFEGVGGVG